MEEIQEKPVPRAHGDVKKLADGLGRIVEDYTYDPYGNAVDSPDSQMQGMLPELRMNQMVSSIDNPFRYAGEYLDAETGNYYLRARYYDPSTQRFISEDSYRGELIAPLSLNRYSYCIGNPIKYVDPSGHVFETVADIASFLYSVEEFRTEKTFVNFGYATMDLLALGLPFIPGTYITRVDDLVDVTKAASKIGGVDDAVKGATILDESIVGMSKPSSRVLRKNLIDAGVGAPTYGNAAHHIVAGAAEKAIEARAVLQTYGVDINDAANGVFLPTIRGMADSAYHPSLHTEAYYREVTDLLSSAGNKDDVMEILDDIANQLMDGTFMK